MRDMSIEPHEPELDQFSEHAADAKENENVTKTGTTTVGITTDEGVAIATDRRASLGGRFVSSKSVVKVERVNERAAITMCGSVGGAQQFMSQLRAEASLYESRRREEMSIEALATLASNFARSGPFFAINPILGGVDENGARVFTIDPAGGVMEDEYAVTGSGMQLAHGQLEQGYSDDLSIEEAREVAATAVEAAAERDTASGNGLALATITYDDGVDIETFDDYDTFL